MRVCYRVCQPHVVQTQPCIAHLPESCATHHWATHSPLGLRLGLWYVQLTQQRTRESDSSRVTLCVHRQTVYIPRTVCGYTVSLSNCLWIYSVTLELSVDIQCHSRTVCGYTVSLSNCLWTYGVTLELSVDILVRCCVTI